MFSGSASDCCNDNPPACNLHTPVSRLHHSLYFRLPPSSRPDSHLRRARLPPRLMYSSITDLLRVPATASEAKSIHAVINASASPWRPFLRGLLAPFRWVSSDIVLFFFVCFHALTSRRQLCALFMMTDRFTWKRSAGKRSEMGPLCPTSTILPLRDRFFQRCGAKV